MQFRSPHTQSLSLAIPRQNDVGCDIVGLFGARRPATIHLPSIIHALRAFTTRIMLCTVFAVNGVFGGRLVAQVVVERLKIVTPAFANLNALIFVILAITFLRVLTSTNDILPRSIFRTITHSVFGRPLSRFIIAQTSATFSVAVTQCLTIYNENTATVALAEPAGVAFVVGFGRAKHEQTAKLATFYVNKTRVSGLRFKNDIINVSHGVYSFLVNSVIRAVERLNLFLRPVSILTQAGGLS